MADIVTRLREWQAEFADTRDEAIYQEAADEIERLRGQIARAAEMVRIKDDLINQMQRRLIAHDLKVPTAKKAKTSD